MELRVLGLRLPLIRPGDDLLRLILKAAAQVGGVRDGDVLVVSSKVVATAQGRIVELTRIRPSQRAKRIAVKTEQSPEFVELVLREANRILAVRKGAILTIKNGMICVNAGVDASNAPPGHVALMPANPDRVAEELRATLMKSSNKKVGMIISDSHVNPLRLGTVGQAVGVAGLEPVADQRSRPDLYGKPLQITFRAVADQLATAAQVVMGEGNERMPVVIVRDIKIDFVEKPKRSPTISPKRCIYFHGATFRK